MSISKDKARGTYYVQCRYRDWTGKQKKTCKRGFRTKREAQEWERDFLARAESRPDMTFAEFYRAYEADVKPTLKLNTWRTKQHIIETKILPFFGGKRVNEITASDVMRWENDLRAMRGSNGVAYSATYLRTVCNQLGAMLNHAVRYYNLASSPMAKVGKVGSKEAREMDFWTREEYLAFSRSMMEKPQSFMAFELLYWCGLRLGELMALTPADFDLERSTVSITKSHQLIDGQDVITAPKTAKSVRTVLMPDFLAEEVADYIRLEGSFAEDDRMFAFSRAFLRHEMERGCREAGVKRIRIHDLRHSHVSLLIEMGYSALAVAERVGHEAVDITYRYAHLFPNVQGDMARDLDGLGGRGRL